MFRDFAARKLNDYLNLLEFPDNNIAFKQVKHSSLPPFIISFIEYYIRNDSVPIGKKDFEELLRKALVFNINYVIRPKYSIIRFLFGDVETRPVEYIKDRLSFFQFYGYYTAQILDFINYNSLEVVSVNQVELVIDEVNKKLLEEICGPGSSDSDRLNLVKILYYFFHDLSDNNPINIKLPRKILSVYFADKGFTDIKKRLDAFFSEDVFIQEAIEIMNPETKRSPKAKSDIDVSEKKVEDIISKAKSVLISKESSKAEIERIIKKELNKSGKSEEVVKPENITELKEETHELPAIDKEKLVVDEEIYSNDLLFAAQFDDLTPPAELTEDEKREKLINDLFCEETFRKRIIKKIFSRQEIKFKAFVQSALSQHGWDGVAALIECHFNKNKINYYSAEAVKFVDILQAHFTKDNDIKENIKAV